MLQVECGIDLVQGRQLFDVDKLNSGRFKGYEQPEYAVRQ
jgi:hypothetical protein